MSRNKIIVGLEVGTSKVAAAVCESSSGGTLQLLGMGTAAAYGVCKGEIVDFAAATACISKALADAEKNSGEKIESVFLSVTGSHIAGFNRRGCVNLPEDRNVINDKDCEDVMLNARDVELPCHEVFLHTILRKYWVDGQEGSLHPVGAHGRNLEADFYIVHATGSRLKTAIRCVKEIGLGIEDVIFGGLASAQVMVTPHQKEMGALVLDIGGGTTDFVLYLDGVVHQCSVLPVGGNHITDDISQRLRISMAQAEHLKTGEGSALQGNDLSREILLSPEGTFPGGAIDRGILNKIIHLRMKETLESIARSLAGEHDLSGLSAGIFITGGTSQLTGLGKLAEGIFDLPVHVNPWPERSLSGSLAENPGFSTVLGLIKYANATLASDPSNPNPFLGRQLRFMHYNW